MRSYLFIFVWIAIMAFFTNKSNINVPLRVDGKIEYRWSLVIALIVFFPVFYLAAFGRPISDTVAYLTIFDEIPVGKEEILQKLSEANGGKGFIVFQYLIKSFFGTNRTAFRVTLALLHAIPVVVVFRKYSENYLLSLFLFVATACHISWMMNGLRQFLAVTIIFATTPMLVKKKYVWVIAAILLATTIHTSAIIMIPVVFIVQGRAWNKKTIFYIIAAIVAMYLFGRYTSLLDSLLVGTEYENATSTWVALGDDGVNPIRVLVNAIPMLLSIVGFKHIEKDNKAINIFINMSVITTGLYLIAVTTSGVMMGRLPIYTSLYNCILMPYLIKKMFDQKSTFLVELALIVFYFVYYCVETGVI